jgi:CRISPR-associated endonuclease Cas2
METKSTLLKILYAAEDVLIFFDDYFKSTSWVYHGTYLSRAQVRKSKNYLKQKNKINSKFHIKGNRRSVLKLITEPWDEKWRLVSFDIPENNRNDRDQLAYQLEKLGLKHFQRSVWITPLPVNEYLKRIAKRIGDQSYLSIFVGSLYNQNPKKLVNELWEIDLWQESAKKLLREIKSDQVDKQSKKRFWDLILNHPKIPLDLLPEKWPLRKLTKVFGEKIKPKTSS